MDSSLHHDPFLPDDALERAPDEEQLSGEPVLDYDKANAKDIATMVGAASKPVAQRVLNYEWEHEKRKTVVAAAQARVEYFDSLPPHENPDTIAALREALGDNNLTAHNERKPPMFQKDRVLRAGATDDEANQLEAEYAASSAEEQQSSDARLAGISESDIRSWLDELREAGHFTSDDTQDTPAPAQEAQVSGPPVVENDAQEKAAAEAAAAEAAASQRRPR